MFQPIYYGPAMKSFAAVCFFLVATWFDSVAAADPEFQSLFNGRDLTDWDGNPELWRVENGVIVGETQSREQLQYNQFLIWRGGTLKNFELRVKCKFSGGNSGIQYRCRELPEIGRWSIGGYQCDVVANADYGGMFFEEKGRGISALNGQRIVFDADGQKWLVGTMPQVPFQAGEWNEYAIIARGNRLVHQVNGQTTAEVVDHDPTKRALDGLLALQLHRGPAMRVEYKDIQLKELPDGGLVTLEDEPLPSDAKPWEKKSAPAKQTKPKPSESPPEPKTSAASPTPSVVKAWIWSADPTTKTAGQVKAEFDLETKAIDQATLRIAGDDGCEAFLNGKSVLANGTWKRANEAEVTKQLQAGRNELRIVGRNNGGPAAIVAWLEIRFTDGSRHDIGTDAKWLAAPLDSSEWRPARVVKAYGQKPYGETFALSPATSNEWPKSAKTTASDAPPELTAASGFQVDLLYTVPKEEQGSWVSATEDDRGRLIVCDQYGSLYRLTPPPLGTTGPTAVEKLKVEMGGAHGLLYAAGSLYVMVNEEPLASGLWRLRDTDGDDQFDERTLLRKLDGRGEHGPHGLTLAPDGQSIYIACGNKVKAPVPLEHIRLATPLADDLVLPRLNGGGVFTEAAPHGYVCKMSLDGSRFELVAAGLRNHFDIAFNALGDLFTYDSDMEWDVGTPWYRPTRIYHLVSGGDYGFRETSGKLPAYHPDVVPPLVEVGPGSPTGVVAGRGAKFPARYQHAIFAADWTYGTIYAVHLTPRGGSYRAELEEFVVGKPLPVTDLVVGRDGALYFLVGGRRTQSAVYRVTYVGKESTAAAPAPDETPEHRQRVALEVLHDEGTGPEAIDAAWPHLGDADRAVRYAARVAVERQPVAQWGRRALEAADGWTALEAGVALARVVGKEFQTPLLEHLNRLDFAKLNAPQRSALVRAYEIAIARNGVPTDDVLAQTTARLEALFPADSREFNRELSQTLVALGSPTVIGKTLDLIAAARDVDEAPTYGDRLDRNAKYAFRFQIEGEKRANVEQIAYAYALRAATVGWTPKLRDAYFAWFPTTAPWQGGNQFRGFLDKMRDESLANVPDAAERKSFDARSAVVIVGLESTVPPPRGPGRDYTVDDVLAILKQAQGKPNFKRGRELFIAGTCYACHRLGGEGGGVGPDLTRSANRYTHRDLLENIVQPSKVISDQYESTLMELSDGRVIVGRIIGEDDGTLLIAADAAKPSLLTEIKLADVESRTRSPTSLMPERLLKPMNPEEVRNLIAYILSGGNSKHPQYH